MQSKRKTAAAAMLCSLAAMALLTGCQDKGSSSAKAGAQPKPTEVTYVEAKSADNLIATELTGRTNAYYEAEIRPQVNGILQKRLFTEGSEVKAGQQLYQIDPSTYEANLKSAQATLAEAQATLVRARADAKRSSALVKINAVSKQSDDSAQATLKSAEAAVKSAQASVQTAKINLQYTKVLSPISGRVGRSDYTAGALMTAYQSTPLTTVQQLDPIYVDVTQNAEDVLRYKREIAAGTMKTDAEGNARVTLKLSDGTVYPHEGKLTFKDVSADESTGTVKLRAVFPNPDRDLLPGLFVRATIEEGLLPNTFLISQQCVRFDVRGNPYVFVIDKDNKIARKNVQTIRSEGTSWVLSGLSEGDRVVFEGFQRVAEGKQVTPKKAENADNLAKNGKPLF
jgi:membrane fusion protein (multidrug efflux system)